MRVCCSGEAMVEMAATGNAGLYCRGIAGDTLNTAVYLARSGLAVDYLTQIGDDSASDDLLRLLAQESVGSSLVTQLAGRSPGLYMIDNDASGERHFSYWRDHSPARETFNAPLTLQGYDAFYFTGITLAVTRSGLTHLLELLHSLRKQGCRVIFDPNYRPGLWDNLEQAQEHYRQVLPLCDMVLPTLSDERELWGIATEDDCLALYKDFGAREVVIKGDGLVASAHYSEEQVTTQAEAVDAIDTTGAGDSFNAGYLSQRLRGASLADSLSTAQALSARVVQHRGAILPREQG